MHPSNNHSRAFPALQVNRNNNLNNDNESPARGFFLALNYRLRGWFLLKRISSTFENINSVYEFTIV
jgi:hypothetical protein